MKLRDGMRYKIRTWRSMENEYGQYMDGSRSFIKSPHCSLIFIEDMMLLCGVYTPALRCSDFNYNYVVLEIGNYTRRYIADYMVDWTAPPLE